MNKGLEYMFDTNAFSWVVREEISVESLAQCGCFLYATHIQEKELKRTPDLIRRENLLKVFKFIEESSKVVMTEGGIWDEVNWDNFTWTDDNALDDFLSDLDNCEKKDNNPRDALIAVTAIKKGFILVTNDRCLRKVVQQHGGQSVSFRVFRNRRLTSLHNV